MVGVFGSTDFTAKQHGKKITDPGKLSKRFGSD